MNILVLGGTRYAGVHLVSKLLSSGHKVTIATRGKTPDDFGSKVTRKIIDRKEPESVRTVLGGESYDVIVDNIAFSSNDVRNLLDAVKTKKYVLTSTASVYPEMRLNLPETEVDTTKTQLKWCNSNDYTYDEVKRQAEAALFQKYSNLSSVAVRFPWIFGTDDYTKRLYFYVKHIYDEQEMNITNINSRLPFIKSSEAGDFLAWCAESSILGSLNASSNGTISLAEIIAHTEKLTGKKALIGQNGEDSPLNGAPDFSLDTAKAQNAGYRFQNITEWVYPTIDFWVNALKNK